MRVLKENIQDQFEFSYDICYECKDYGEILRIWNHAPSKRRDPLRLRLDYELWNRDVLPWKTHHGVRWPKLWPQVQQFILFLCTQNNTRKWDRNNWKVWHNFHFSDGWELPLTAATENRSPLLQIGSCSISLGTSFVTTMQGDNDDNLPAFIRNTWLYSYC